MTNVPVSEPHFLLSDLVSERIWFMVTEAQMEICPRRNDEEELWSAGVELTEWVISV